MKKEYMKPEQREVKIQHQSLICESVSGVNGNVFNQNTISGSNQAARVKENSYSVWDDDWSN